MANLFAIWVPMLDHKLECPACHQQVEVKVQVVGTAADVRRTGGDSFRSNISSSVATASSKMRILHECDILEEEN